MRHNKANLTGGLSTWSLLVMALLGSGCASTRVELSGDFPVPLVAPSPTRVAIVLSPELLNYVHTETLARGGDYSINVGAAQKLLFQRLAQGAFDDYELTTQLAATSYDGSLVPVIEDLQFSTPAQTRTDYYEVWIRYRFDIYDQTATKLGSWDLPAYGKANVANHGNDNQGLYAAAIAACRDMAAMFSLNFSSAQTANQWLQPATTTNATQGGSGS